MSDFVNTIDALGDKVVIDTIIDRSITEFKDDKITQIGQGAFYNCKELTNIAFPNATKFTGSVDRIIGAFENCTGLTEITDEQFPSLTHLTYAAFRGCKGITKVSLSNVSDLSWYALHQCPLSELNLPNLKSIGMNGWRLSNPDTHLVFPKLKLITNYAVVFGSKVEYVDFASTSDEVLSISTSQNFSGDTKLATMIIRSSSVATLASAALGNTPIGKGTGYIYVPAALVDSYKVATNWSTYADQFRALEDYTIDGTITGELDETKI